MIASFVMVPAYVVGQHRIRGDHPVVMPTNHSFPMCIKSDGVIANFSARQKGWPIANSMACATAWLVPEWAG
jgi:hypothetical protein